MSGRRIAALRNALDASNWQAMIISQPENRRYLSGFTGSDGYLLVTAQLAVLLTDFRYVEQAATEAPEFEINQVRDSLDAGLEQLLAERALHQVAFESDHVTVGTHRKWSEDSPDVDWIPTQNVVEKLRMIKDAAEIESIRRAVRLGDAAFQHLTQIIRPHMTEREIAWELELYIRTHDAGERIAFDLIVGSGPNGAMPHATVTDREVRRGEPVVLDLGAVIDGYHSDMTRTICLGQSDSKFDEIYDVILTAQESAEKTIRPGMTGQEADSIAREVIQQAGFGSHFGHSLGHGVGLAIHEGPRLRQTSTDVLEPGMVVTVEPGIYLPDWGGVRIEDTVVITEEGCEILTQSSKQPLV